MKVKLPPTKNASVFRPANEENKLLADKINEGGHFDKFSADVAQAKQAFKKFPFGQASIHAIQDWLAECGLNRFTDCEYPPTDMAIYDPEEPYPFSEEVVWRRARDFLADEAGKPPKVFTSISPSDIKEG